MQKNREIDMFAILLYMIQRDETNDFLPYTFVFK